jgi:hypothetical protein
MRVPLRETLVGIGFSWARGDEIGLVVGKAARQWSSVVSAGGHTGLAPAVVFFSNVQVEQFVEGVDLEALAGPERRNLVLRPLEITARIHPISHIILYYIYIILYYICIYVFVFVFEYLLMTTSAALAGSRLGTIATGGRMGSLDLKRS